MTIDGRILRGLFEHKWLKTSKYKNQSGKYSKFGVIKEFKYTISLQRSTYTNT